MGFFIGMLLFFVASFCFWMMGKLWDELFEFFKKGKP